MGPMLCPVLIDRGAEMQALTSALDAAGQGRGSVVFVTGDPGVGKSRLMREAVAAAGGRGFLTLTGRATQSSVPVPYRPISEALMGAARAGVVPDAPGIAECRAALGTLVPGWSRPADGDAEVSPVIYGEALLRVLSLPGRPGGLLVIEDLHWADPETVAIIEYLVDNVASTNVACLVTMRDSVPSAALDLLGCVTARRAATAIEVTRLTTEDVSDMIAACLGVTDAPAAVRKLVEDADGLPFAVEEILAAAVSSGQLVTGQAGWQVNENVVTGLPSSIVGSVRERIATLSQEARNVVVSAAVLGRQFDYTLLGAVAGASEAEVLEALHEANDMQLIETAPPDTSAFRFRHSLTRDAIVSALLPPELAARSARAAAAIETAHPGLPGAWCELVAELRATAGEPVPAARLLLTVSRRDLLQGAVTSAMSTLRDARQLVTQSGSASAQGDAALLIDIDEALAHALALSGDVRELERMVAGLLSRLDGTDLRREALIRIQAASTSPEDNPDAAAAHLMASGAIAGQLGDLELASRVDTAAARYALAAGELDQGEILARQSLAAAETAGLTGWAAEVAVESLGVLGRRERISDPRAARPLFERARKIADDNGLGAARIKALHDLATIDMLVDGQTGGLTEVRALAIDGGQFSIATIIDLQLANLWSLGEDLDQALAAARRCESGARRTGSRRIEAMALELQALVHGIRGDSRAAEQAVHHAEAILPGDPEVMLTNASQVRVVLALFRDDIRRAERSNASADEYAAQMLTAPRRVRGFYSPGQVPLVARGRSWALRALLAAVGGGAAGAAIKQAELVGAVHSWNRGCLAYAGAVLAGRAGQPARANELAADGAAAFAPFAPWWNHLARRLVAPCALDDGWGEPVAWMHEAAPVFDATGHAQLASACRGILRRAGVPVPRAGRGTAQVPAQLRQLGVTSREMDVYLLVARGYSNPEIAAKLFISPKTVETHVAKLVTKTGQSGRRELVAHAARHIRNLVVPRQAWTAVANSELRSVLTQGSPDAWSQPAARWLLAKKLPRGNRQPVRRHLMHATAAAPTCTGDSFERDAIPYMDQLYPAALRLTQDRGHAEDLIQETFTRAYVKFHQYTPGTNLRAWLYRIMFTTFYSSCRQRGRRPAEVLTDEQGASRGRAPVPAVSSAEAEALGGLGDSGIGRALADLPAAYKTVIYLADVEGYQCGEIASLLRIPIGTVMSRMHRGRAMLRAKLRPPRPVTPLRTHPPALAAPDNQDVPRLAA